MVGSFALEIGKSRLNTAILRGDDPAGGGQLAPRHRVGDRVPLPAADLSSLGDPRAILLGEKGLEQLARILRMTGVLVADADIDPSRPFREKPAVEGRHQFVE